MTQNETLAADLQLKCETIAYDTVERVWFFMALSILIESFTACHVDEVTKWK